MICRRDHRRGATAAAGVELVLQVCESHLYLLVKFHDLIYITNVKCKLLNVCVFKGKGCCVNC